MIHFHHVSSMSLAQLRPAETGTHMPVGRCWRKPDGSNSHCSCKGPNHPQPPDRLSLGSAWQQWNGIGFAGPQPCISPSPTRVILASEYAQWLEPATCFDRILDTSCDQPQHATKGWLLRDSPEDESHDIKFESISMLHKITRLNHIESIHVSLGKTFHLDSSMHLNPVWCQGPNEPMSQQILRAAQLRQGAQKCEP